MMKLKFNRITISGFAGSGKSALGKKLADYLDWRFISIGSYTRDFAKKEYGLGINEFQDFVENKPEIDYEIDASFAKRCNSSQNLIIDWRLGFHFVEDALNVFLNVSVDVAAKRMKEAQRTDEFGGKKAKEIMQISNMRNQKMKDRFYNLYVTDFTDIKNFDLVINTDKLTLDDELAIILEKIERNGC
jgi:radical S-adenosyl methionine domain-containing protein 2